MEAEGASKDVCREGLNLVVVFLGSGIEEATACGELVFDVRDFFLELNEVLVRLQIRIGFEGNLQSVQGGGELAFGGDLLVDRVCGHGAGTGFCHRL